MRHDFGPWRPDAHHLFPFRFWDDVRGKWARARYVAELQVIAARHQRYEIIGPPELRPKGGDTFTSRFMRKLGEPVLAPAPLANITHPVLTDPERLLVRTFLRRYVTYCARTRREHQASGAATLWHKLDAT